VHLVYDKQNRLPLKLRASVDYSFRNCETAW